MLGYLNLSSGAPDPRFRANLNELFQQAGEVEEPTPRWVLLKDLLLEELALQRGVSSAFTDVTQAESVITLAIDQLLPAYREHHRDLLPHLSDEELFQPFFLASCFEKVLQQGGPWDDLQLVERALVALNDFVGYRPVAVLHSEREMEPYDHEWVRPIPIYFREGGIASGPYHELARQTLEILRSADPDLLEVAWFDLNLLDELALDPRAYDFDHPVNRRPSYQYGQWDPHQVDQKGNYRRFVLVSITVDAMLERLEQTPDLPRAELLYEAGAVLAGTMLMASGVSGYGPSAHDSSMSLSKLLPRIVQYRDAFYDRLLRGMSCPHGDRLRQEAQTRHQPFAGARQDLNQRLARMRARQQQHVHLAQLFARMGYAQASRQQVDVVPVASARMLCDIECQITVGHHQLDRSQLPDAAQSLFSIEDLLHRGIECGAIVDPRNMLGFGGNFSLFPAVENSVKDHRIDELLDLVESIFDFAGRLQSEAAAQGNPGVEQQVRERFFGLTEWWDRFASTEVSGINGISGFEASHSAAHVANALRAWNQAGASTDDLNFWREHVANFHSPKAYVLVVEALLDKHDLRAAMALLMQWLSQMEQIPLEQGKYSFRQLAGRWIFQCCLMPADDPSPLLSAERWSLLVRFFDYLEANADEAWRVPRFELIGDTPAPSGELAGEEGDEEDDLFSAAYEDVIYRDTTRDGFEGDMLEEGGSSTQFELDTEARRLNTRLGFLSTVAFCWQAAARPDVRDDVDMPARHGALQRWLQSAHTHLEGLSQLLDAVRAHRIPEPSSSYDSLLEYDRRRIVKDQLVERIIDTIVEMRSACRTLDGALPGDLASPTSADWETALMPVLRALRRRDAVEARALVPHLIETLRTRPLLYVPLSRHGNPHQIAEAQVLQSVFKELLIRLPRLGLLTEAGRLVKLAQEMEREIPVGPGAVSEFDRLYTVGFRAMVDCVVQSATSWPHEGAASPGDPGPGALVEALQRLVEVMLMPWMSHSKTLRLSVLERVMDQRRWKTLVEFIQQYGADLFTPDFLNVGNLRAIAHQGVGNYLRTLLEERPADRDFKLLDDLDQKIPMSQAVDQLLLIVDAIIENYPEYKDYNSTTTQSDRGEQLYVFLDVLRLKSSYDRSAWNLKPVMITHEVLVQRHRLAEAEFWRRIVTSQTGDAAQSHVDQLAALSQRYGMQLPTISDHIGERFVRPLSIDRIRALIQPAMEEFRQDEPAVSFRILEEELREFTQAPTGAGLDVPDWLIALEKEVDLAEARGEHGPLVPPWQFPPAQLSYEEVLRQFDELGQE